MKMLYKKTAFMIYLFITQACAFLCVRNKNVFIAHFIEKFVFTLFRLFLIISNMLSNKCMDQYCTINTFSLRLFVTLTYILVVYSLKKKYYFNALSATSRIFKMGYRFNAWPPFCSCISPFSPLLSPLEAS